MNILVLDAETHFSSEYTLKKQTTEHYVRDERFECLGWGARLPDGELRWMRDAEARTFFATIDWSQTCVLAHHAQFDGLILSHHYGIQPAMWLDTLSMARLALGNHLSVALGSLASHYGLEAKQIDYSSETGFKGRRAADLTPELWKMLGDGCLHDVQLTWDIFKRLAEGFPAEEYKIIDMTVRMFTEPRLEGDQKLFEEVRDREFLRKNEAMLALGVSKADLQSSAKFCALLEAEGIEIEWKDGKNGPIPAVAKTDDFMKQLTESENERVADLATCRLEGKSTIDETRAGRFAQMASRGALPIYLGYCAAHTTRWGGGDKVNLQNLKRGGDLRRGLVAPSNYLIAVADKSQIECRLLNAVAGQTDVVERFRNKEDPYLPVASTFYGREITKADKLERQVGKVIELACGYGMGSKRFQATLKQSSIVLNDQEAQRGIDAYRNTHPHVTALWRDADQWLLYLRHEGTAFDAACCSFRHKTIILPNGAPMHYVLDRRHDDNGRLAWYRKTRRGWVKIWGGHLVENIIQALGRVDISQTFLRIQKRLPPVVGNVVMTSHDEGTWLLPASEAQAMLDEVILPEFRRSPAWLPGVPLDAEGGLGERYGDVK